MEKDGNYGMHEAAPISGTEALLRKELQVGRYYECLLSRKRVLYVGGNQIKWYSPDTDEYRTDTVSDYQLIPGTAGE